MTTELCGTQQIRAPSISRDKAIARQGSIIAALAARRGERPFAYNRNRFQRR
jgi:hypothetical protein